MPLWLATMKPSTLIHIGLGFVIALLLAWVVRIDHLRGAHLKDLQASNAAYTKLVADTKAASAVALAAQQAVVQKKEQEYVAKADASDARYADLRKQYDAAVLRARAAAGRGGAVATGSAAQGDGAGVPAQGAALPQLCLSDDDAMKLSDLQAYAEAAHEWAMSIDSSNASQAETPATK